MSVIGRFSIVPPWKDDELLGNNSSSSSGLSWSHVCSTVGQSDLPVREMQNATLICNNFLVCGRYRLSRRKQVVEEYFDAAPVEHNWNPRYNIAPTQNVPIIRQNPKEPVREMSFVRRGLIPSWARDSSVAAKMINARSETASMKPAFRDALKCRRCLIPGDAFYEWTRIGKSKQPCSSQCSISFPSFTRHISMLRIWTAVPLG